MKLKLGILILGAIAFAPPAFAQNCKLTESVYRDVNGKGFELIFQKTSRTFSGNYANAVIKHGNEGEMYRFGVGQSQGYGSTFLEERNRYANEHTLHTVNFFNNNLKSISLMLGREESVPQYLFVNGLGSLDYYTVGRRTSSIPLIGDTLWVFDRCQN